MYLSSIHFPYHRLGALPFAQRSRGRRRFCRSAAEAKMWRSPRSAATSACPVLYEAARKYSKVAEATDGVGVSSGLVLYFN